MLLKELVKKGNKPKKREAKKEEKKEPKVDVQNMREKIKSQFDKAFQ